MNFSAIALVAAVLLILASHRADGESMVSLLQPSAFMIVLGGTFCAAVVNFKPSTLMTALRSSVDVFLERQPSQIKVIDEIIYLAHQAKMKGLFYLNNLVDDIQDPFLKRGVQLSIDFNNPQMIYDILKAEISYDEEEELINSRVFEALGGYAPTFGIVGAVFGLIQIMGYIQQPDILAQGIAVAFVSTLYGVGFANLLFLPVAGKLKMNTRERILLKEVVLQGIVSIQMEESPMVIEEKLVAYLKYHNKTHSIENRKQTGLYGLR